MSSKSFTIWVQNSVAYFFELNGFKETFAAYFAVILRSDFPEIFNTFKIRVFFFFFKNSRNIFKTTCNYRDFYFV